jgi:hypothetical protein
VSFDLSRLFEGVIETLRAEVVPHVTDADARGQAVGVIDLIGNIAGRVEWARRPLIDSVEEKRKLLDVVAAALGEPTPSQRERAEELDTGPLIVELGRLDGEICEAMRRAHRRSDDSGAREALTLMIRHAHDEANAAMKWTRKPQFGEMVSGKVTRPGPQADP